MEWGGLEEQIRWGGYNRGGREGGRETWVWGCTLNTVRGDYQRVMAHGKVTNYPLLRESNRQRNNYGWRKDLLTHLHPLMGHLSPFTASGKMENYDHQQP